MSDNRIPTPHINAPAGAFAETVLMPGDPLRSRLIAERFLEDAQLVNNVRGVQGYTGTWQGKRVSVMASGMGCPSIGIYSYELFHFYGVENIIRIGSAGAMNEKIKVRDIVIGMSAYTNSAYLRSFGFTGNCAPCADYDLLSRAVETARKMGLRVHCGPLYTSDVFYAEDTRDSAILQKLGVLAVEMETAALYANAAAAGKKALAICTISDHTLTGESLPAEERQNSFEDMIRLGLSLA
ncbi:MAG: purine-nucleoside phosphorylase [Clostridia bacterium]|nr:purine-nucleoside phosphorylase [Clostridia bacterium]